MSTSGKKEPVRFVRAIAERPCFCMTFFGVMMVIFMMAAVMSIGNQLRDPDAPDFPTTDNSGFLDIDDVYSLRMNAVVEAMRLKENEQAKEVETNTVEPQQSVNMGRWALTMLYKAKTGDNAFTPSNVKKMKEVNDVISSESGYSDFCLMAKGGMESMMGDIVQMGLTGAAPSRNYTCSMPMSVLNYLYPSVQKVKYTKNGDDFILHSTMEGTTLGNMLVNGATSSSYPSIEYNGKGTVLAPCAPDATMAAAGALQYKTTPQCALPGQVRTMMNAAPFVHPLVKAMMAPNTSIGGCNMCNPGGCSCAAGVRTGYTGGDLQEGGQAEIDGLMAEMARLPFLAFLLGKEFSSNNLKSQVTRYTVNFGAPLAGFANSSQGESSGGFGAGDQTKLFEVFAKSLKTKLDVYRDTDGDLEILYFWPLVTFAEILNVLLHDGLLALGSVGFVGMYIHFHTGSSFLAGCGMFHIFMSFPLAFCIYRFVFGIMPVYTLSFLSIYVVLAIGADDVFVFVDAWKQSAAAGPEVNADIVSRMSWVYRRAVKAMLVTSLTTFGAFAATSISPLNDVATFGLMTALLVASNYFFVITWFPCVVLVYHKYFESRPGCCCCLGRRRHPRLKYPGTSDAAIDPNFEAPAAEVAEEGAAEVDKFAHESRVEKFFRTKYVPVLKNRNFQIVSVSTMIVIGIVFLGLASQLGPTSKEDQLLPDWHPFQRIINMFNEDFKTGGDTPMRTSDLVFGLDASKPLDRAGLNRYDVGSANTAGKLVFDSSFDLSEPTSQQFFLDTCDALLAASSPSLVREGSGLGAREINCVMRGLKDFITAANAGILVGWRNGPFAFSFPVPKAQFGATMKLWFEFRANMTGPGRQWSPHESYEDVIWMDESTNVVKLAVIRANTTIGAFDASYNVLKAAHDAWAKFVDDRNANAPAAAKMFLSAASGRQGSGAWVFMTTQSLLVQGAMVGAGISGVFAFFILMASTLNPLLAFLSITNIIGIVACIMGSMYCMGWELGVIESVSITVLVGLSVDYVVHLANSYIESHRSSRMDRAEDSSLEMGVTVFGGAITSLGASFMLFLCYFQYFFKFGCFMFLTIFLSFAWAFLYFLPLAALVGPEGSQCAITFGGRIGGDSEKSEVSVPVERVTGVSPPEIHTDDVKPIQD